MNEKNKLEHLHSTLAKEVECFHLRLVKVIGKESVRSFARRAELSETVMRKYTTGESTPNVERLVAIARAANVSVAWLAAGEGPMRTEELVQPGVADSQRVYAPIPRFTRQVDGREEEVGSEIASVSFNRKWLEEKGLLPTNLLYTRMHDDSMQPTIPEGALIVVDSSTDKIKEDGLYALMHLGDIAVKRFQVEFGGGIWIRSDNPAYKEQHVPAEKCGALYIMGRVIWIGSEV